MKTQRPELCFILVEPQMGENIGAAARAMKNFGFSQLRIVNPRDGWPNPKAEAMSVGAVDIIKTAKIFHRLTDAIEDVEYLYATASTKRDLNKIVTQPDHININNLQHFKKIAVMFGRESCGLHNDEITHANEIITIPTANLHSMNIAQAVAIISYEFAKILNPQTKQPQEHTTTEMATHQELEYFQQHLLGLLENANFFRVPHKKIHTTRKIRNLLTRIPQLSKQELQILYGIVNILQKQ